MIATDKIVETGQFTTRDAPIRHRPIIGRPMIGA